MGAVAHERLQVRVGSACDPEFLTRVALGHDALVSTLGPRWPTRAAAAVYAESGAAIADAAAAAGIDRVLITSSALLFPTPAWTTRMLKALVRPIVDGAQEMEVRVTSRDLGWTIVRTGFLKDGDDAELRLGVESFPEDPRAVSRGAVARFLLGELTKGRHRQRTVGVCG